MDLESFNQELISGLPVFRAVSPGLESFIPVFRGIETARAYRKIQEGKPLSQVIGEKFGNVIVGQVMSPVRMKLMEFHMNRSKGIAVQGVTPNELTSRTWIEETGQVDMVIVFHDAYRVGPHIDVHIGHFSLIYRVKPDLYAQLKLKSDGYLTEESKKMLLEHIRVEINNSSRVPQNLDHTPRDARESWVNNTEVSSMYGAGSTRQVISESRVEIIKVKSDVSSTIELYAPILNGDRMMYIHQLYPGKETKNGSKTAPILVWGNKKPHPPAFKDRLHLKLMHPHDLEKLQNKADMSTSTAKYDGASCYIVTGPKGTTLWSPRISKRTGEPIEYTFKVPGISSHKTKETTVSMGELIFTRNGKPLSAAEIGGILNSKSVIPEDVVPEIRLYRTDKVGRKSLENADFWENRQIQEALITETGSEILKIAELMGPEEAKSQGFEGIVVVPKDGSVNQGFKVKWWTDADDWVIDSIDFKPGDKGGLAGVVWLTSLESGKKFKLGPGQIGTRELCETMMNDPDSFVGQVLKVKSRHGHEGRSSKVVDFHLDKGFGE